ncbi:hypothetical protein ACFL1L_02825 [Thermoplasmatota archaeon]
MNDLDEDKEEELPKLFCPVIKDTCLRYGCMFYIKVPGKKEDYWDCAYIHAYNNLGFISP